MAKSIASDFLDALAESRFDVHIIAQTIFLDSDIDPPRSAFNRDWIQMKKNIENISMSTERSCNLDAIIKVRSFSTEKLINSIIRPRDFWLGTMTNSPVILFV